MRTLERNKIKFFYSLYAGREEIVDEYGNKTGEYEVKYFPPKQFLANISTSKGETQIQQFGGSEDYDRVLVLDLKSPLIDEYSILWIDTLPIINDDGFTKTPHDYVVKKVAKSLNSVSIAVSKVKVDIGYSNGN